MFKRYFKKQINKLINLNIKQKIIFLFKFKIEIIKNFINIVNTNLASKKDILDCLRSRIKLFFENIDSENQILDHIIICIYDLFKNIF